MVAVRQRRPSVLVALVLVLLHPGIATARQLGSAGSSAAFVVEVRSPTPVGVARTPWWRRIASGLAKSAASRDVMDLSWRSMA